jgi:cytoskeleton protein RodZ
MNSVGAILRSERERQGREMAEIAEELCITQRYLRAIEQNDLKSLPGSFFYKSFVKQYAAILSMDERLLQSGVEALVVAEEPPALPNADPRYSSSAPNGGIGLNLSSSAAAIENGPSPVRNVDPIVRDGNRRYLPQGPVGVSMAALVAVLLLCSGFYAWWNKAPESLSSNRGDRGVARSAGSGGIMPVKSSVGPQVPQLNVTTSTGPDGVNRVVLSLSATEKTWLSITADGKKIFSGVLEPSQTKTLAGSDVATMKVGNAGGIEVLWNGKSIGPIGPRGQVREVMFTPDNFEIKQPVKPL